MNGWTVLFILHLVAWGFCTLWVLGSCWKEGMWSNTVTWVNWWQAYWVSVLGRGIVEQIVNSVVAPKSSDDYFTVAAVSIAVQWILFIAVFLGVKSWSDKLARVKVAFHPVFDGVANAVACLLLACGIMLSTLELFGITIIGKAFREATISQKSFALPDKLGWLKGDGSGLPWQMATLFCGYWVLVAVAIVVLSKSANRLDRPKKVEEEA